VIAYRVYLITWVLVFLLQEISLLRCGQQWLCWLVLWAGLGGLRERAEICRGQK